MCDTRDERIGAMFGSLFGDRLHGYASALGWGSAYGFAWWVVGGLVLMPILLGMPAFAPLTMPPMRPVGMGSLVGHLVYGAILGAGFAGCTGKHRIALRCTPEPFVRHRSTRVWPKAGSSKV